MKYTEAKALFETAKNKYSGKPLPGRCGSTRLVERDGLYCVRFHNTLVVSIDDTDACILRNGGYFTPSTKERIEEYSGVYIVSSNNVWYVRSKKDKTWPGSRLWTFVDGMHVDKNGIPFDRQPVGIKLVEFTAKTWTEHIRIERNRLARERRKERKAQAERDARYAKDREERQRSCLNSLLRQREAIDKAENERIEGERKARLMKQNESLQDVPEHMRPATIENGLKRTKEQMRSIFRAISNPTKTLVEHEDYRIGQLRGTYVPVSNGADE